MTEMAYPWNLLVEGVGQWLHGVDWHLAVVPRGEHSALPNVVLPRIPHYQQVILFKCQMLLTVFILLTSGEQRLGKKRSCKGEMRACANVRSIRLRESRCRGFQ